MIRIPYKTFFIRMASTGLWWIEHPTSGLCVMAANDQKDAERIIDQFTGTYSILPS